MISLSASDASSLGCMQMWCVGICLRSTRASLSIKRHNKIFIITFFRFWCCSHAPHDVVDMYVDWMRFRLCAVIVWIDMYATEKTKRIERRDECENGILSQCTHELECNMKSKLINDVDFDWISGCISIHWLGCASLCVFILYCSSATMHSSSHAHKSCAVIFHT